MERAHEELEREIRSLKDYVGRILERQRGVLEQLDALVKGLKARAREGGISYRVARGELKTLIELACELQGLSVSLGEATATLSELEDLKWKISGRPP